MENRMLELRDQRLWILRRVFAEMAFRTGTALCLLMVAGGCSTEREQRDNERWLSQVDSARVIQDVLDGVNRFHAADTSRDANAVIALLWPEFTMLADGKRMLYPEVVAGSKQFMSSLSEFHTEWSDLTVVPISKNAAISSFMFRDSLVTTAGDITLHRGPTTLVWQRRDGVWKVLYGDADHYPIKADKPNSHD